MRDVCLPLAARAGLDRVRAVAVLADVVAARRAGPGAGAACGHAAGQFQPQGRHDRRARAGHVLARRAQWRGPARRRAGGSRRIRVRREPVLAQRLVGRGPAGAGARRYDGRYATAVFRFAHQSPGPGAERGGTCTDDADAQRRVGAASLSWRRVSQVSQERARAMGQLLETAESPGAGPRCPWIGSRHGMTWQRPTACSRMGAAVRLLLSPFFATSCARGGARAASRFGSVAEICRRALAATLALTAGALPRAGARPCKPVAGCGD